MESNAISGKVQPPLVTAKNENAIDRLAGAQRLVTGDEARIISIWNAENGKQEGTSMEHESSIWSLGVDSDGTKIVSNDNENSKPSNAPKEAMRIDMLSMPSHLKTPRRRAGPLDINAAKRNMSALPRSALATVRNIERFQDIEYPEGVRSPRDDLNKDAKDGKFRYDRDFLVQFMPLCKERPSNLPPLEILGIVPVDRSTLSKTRGGSGRHRQPSSAMPPIPCQSSVGFGIFGGFGTTVTAGNENAIDSLTGAQRPATCDEARTIRICNAESGKQEGTSTEHESSIWNLAVNSDGTKIASSDNENRVASLPNPSGSVRFSQSDHYSELTDINAAKKDMSTPLSAFATARKLERLQDIEYPEGISSPREDLNKDVKDSKFRYDRDFLMQFMHFCKGKPPNLAPLDGLGIEPVDQSTLNRTRGGPGRHRKPASAMAPIACQSSVELGISGGLGMKPGATPSPFAMGQFSNPTSKLTSEERYMISTGTHSASVSSGPVALQFGRHMTRTALQGGPGGHHMGSNRTRTKRGDRRADANKIPLSQQGEGPGFGVPGTLPVPGAALQPVAPLEVSANRWVAPSTIQNPGATESPELVVRKVRAFLNKLTTEKFDSISDQIIAWVNKSENEKDGRTLIQVIRIVVEKATHEATRSEMYARLCQKMMETISPEIQDYGMRNSEGKPIAGGQLFRNYLLNCCQENFERGWVAKEATAAAAATNLKASDDQAIRAADERKGDESELYLDECYDAQRAKRQGLSLIKFIGELFKLQIPTERVIHECVKKLLTNVENTREEKMESLCQLLKTAGQLLDVPKARAHMDVYFVRMKELCKSPYVSPRIQFMLQDVIELRDRKWVARSAVIAPTTISAVHGAAAKKRAAAVAQKYQRQLGMSGDGSRRSGDRNAEPGPDGRTTAGGSVARPQPKAGDSQFGKISNASPMVMGPSNVFTKKQLKLLPRKKRTPAVETPPPALEGEPEAAVQMSEANAKRKIDEDVKEFFAVRSMDEADVYFTNLPNEHRFRLVDKLVGFALQSKKADAVLVSEFFAQAASKGQCSSEEFEAGFMPTAEFLDDIAIDAPNTFKFMAIMLKGAGFDKDKERLGRIAGKSMDSDKLLQLVPS